MNEGSEDMVIKNDAEMNFAEERSKDYMMNSILLRNKFDTSDGILKVNVLFESGGNRGS